MPRLTVSLGIIFVIALAGFLSLYLTTTEGPVTPASEPPLPAISIVSLADRYADGVHTVTGVATVPTRCMPITTAARVTEEERPMIRIDLSASDDGEVCLALPAKREFTVDVEAPNDATLVIYGNGRDITPPPS